MVVLDVHVEDMDRTVQLATFIMQVFEDSIKAALFAGNDNVDNARLGALEAFVFAVVEARFARDPVLKAFGEALDVEIAAQHVQQAIVGVKGRVLFGKLIVNGAIGGAVEVVDVWLMRSWAGKAHERACAKGDCWEVSGGELEMCFHGAVLVTGTHGAELELEFVISDHVGFGVSIIGAARGLGLGFGWRWWRWRRRGCRRRCKDRLLLPRP